MHEFVPVNDFFTYSKKNPESVPHNNAYESETGFNNQQGQKKIKIKNSTY